MPPSPGQLACHPDGWMGWVVRHKEPRSLGQHLKLIFGAGLTPLVLFATQTFAQAGLGAGLTPFVLLVTEELTANKPKDVSNHNSKTKKSNQNSKTHKSNQNLKTWEHHPGHLLATPGPGRQLSHFDVSGQ